MPQIPEMITSGSARDISPSNTYRASSWSTKMPANAMTPVTIAVATARRRKYSTMSSSCSRRASHTR